MTAPSWVNLSALEMRFWKTISMRSTSAWMAVTVLPSSASRMPFFSAMTVKGASSEPSRPYSSTGW